MKVRALIDGEWTVLSGTTVSLTREEGGEMELRLVLDDDGHVRSHEVVSLEG